MGAFIARQPNGLLCRFSSVVDCVTNYNMTEEEYVQMVAEAAADEARINLTKKHFVKPYQMVIDSFIPGDMTEEEFIDIRRKMGEQIEQKIEDAILAE